MTAAPSPAAPVLSVRGLSKRYYIGPDADSGAKKGAESELWALRDVSFNVARGERVGIIGRNGAGKSTLLKILSRVAYPTEGEARVRGRLTSLLEVGTGFNEALTGRENIFLNASLHGLSRPETQARLNDIIDFAEIRRFIDTPIRYYSSGMRSRLAFSVAAHLNPDILLLDEVLAVGDMAFQRKCLERMEDITSAGQTLLFVSHSLDSVMRFCDRCLWMDHGRIVEDGPSKQVLEAYAKRVMALAPAVKFHAASLPKEDSAQPQKSNLLGPAKPPWGRLLAARAVADGAEAASLFVDAEFALEIDYEILYDDVVVLPACRVYNEAGDLVFISVVPETGGENQKRRKGAYRSRVRVPPHLLNIGMHRVNVSLSTPGGRKLIRHQEEDGLSFWVYEAKAGGVSARGPYESVPGAVRPLLEWRTTPLEGVD